jgi:hypothetical protein
LHRIGAKVFRGRNAHAVLLCFFSYRFYIDSDLSTSLMQGRYLDLRRHFYVSCRLFRFFRGQREFKSCVTSQVLRARAMIFKMNLRSPSLYWNLSFGK